MGDLGRSDRNTRHLMSNYIPSILADVNDRLKEGMEAVPRLAFMVEKIRLRAFLSSHCPSLFKVSLRPQYGHLIFSLITLLSL